METSAERNFSEQLWHKVQDMWYHSEGPLLHARQIAWRYIKASHQNDPGRTILEILLIFFVIRTWTQSRTRSEASGRNFVKLSEKEIDDLVDDWHPEPLTVEDPQDQYEPPTIVGTPTLHPKVLVSGKTDPISAVNLASSNFSGLAGNEHIKDKAIECLRSYGVGSCGPPGFYGTFDVHINLEKSLAQFLGVEAAIIYTQGFSTVSSVIPAFAKRGDIIVADRGVNFAIQKGIQISRCTVYWYDHNDMDDLERVLRKVQSDNRRKPLTRRFIVSEALFEMDGQVVDLPRLLELKVAFKYRLVLDETWSFGILGEAGRGITEAFDVPGTDVDIIVGSMAVGLCASGGFCAGSLEICSHQRINSPAYVFSAALPPLLAVSATEALHYLVTPTKANSNEPERLPLAKLSDNVQVIRSVLDKIQTLVIPSDPLSPVIHLHLAPKALKNSSNSRDDHQAALQDIVDEALANGVLLTRAMKVWNQEALMRDQHAAGLLQPSIRLCVSAGLTKKECEKSAAVIRSAVNKVIGRKR